MDYIIKAETIAGNDGDISIKQSKIPFGTTPNKAESLPNPAELFLGAFASCILKNVERFSEMMKFSYSKTSLLVKATRLENPPRIDEVSYELVVYSQDEKLNTC
ncbi:OsmC family protein [Pricia sp. S334]|uniref:OsmC family protein n=1 Tax=Pricia mediterranea TaxID=3076079 RepID=A0ABU3L3I4_9FLAO|nr:OsmC family protein [Pricia sp. S334]MDT7828310.1 OsmC family protein [Pricia sp. S334]